MKVIRAGEMGMCFGVRDALAAAEHLDAPTEVTIHGELVHNEEVLDGLRRRGFHVAAEEARDHVPATPRVLVTAHGISERERRRLEAAGKELIDTTCPLVRFVHASALRLAAEGYLVAVIGRASHVEVQGIVGDLDRWVVVERAEDARAYGAARIGIVCQSTTRPDDAARVRRAIEQANPAAEIRFVDTICGPTRNRQVAAEELLAEVEAVVVVGGSRSNNTRQLALLAEARGLPALHVQGARDLDPTWLARFQVVGLTAGTSTLASTIDEVHQALLAM